MVCDKMKLYKGDCLIESDKIESGSIDLILTDLPYGTVKDIKNVNHGMSGKCEWDEVINTNEVYKVANRILRKNGKMVLFAQQPFTNELINKAVANVPHNYNMIWEKDHFANALTAKKAPLNYYEDVLVFRKAEDTEFKHPLRDYAVKVLKWIDEPIKSVLECIGMGNIRFFRIKQNEFAKPTKKAYDKIIELFEINQMEGFLNYDEILKIDAEYKNTTKSTFNLWEGKKYKSNILKYKKDYNGYHPTQKPVLLLEDLIKTFSNENDLVVDLTMGSGSTGVACKNTNRNFIGIEQDENYFNIAQQRIKETEYKLF
jgi:site-specific DNA-methyltransferase (adenine-specific)